MAAITREAERERLERVTLTAQLELEAEAREFKLLKRMEREVMRVGMDRDGSRGGTQSRFARICRQWRGEPAHREPGQCCCGQPATSARGASCDRCRERNRHYRRRYRARLRESQKREAGGSGALTVIWRCNVSGRSGSLLRLSDSSSGQYLCASIQSAIRSTNSVAELLPTTIPA